MKSHKDIVGFEKVGDGCWYIFADGTKLSTGDGDKILRYMRTIYVDRKSANFSEALGYVLALARFRATKALHTIGKKLNSTKDE